MSRRYPNRRHVDIDFTPELRRRRNLSRVSISIAVIFGLLVLLSPFFPTFLGADDDPGDDATSALQPIEGALVVEVVEIIDGDTLDVRSAQTELRVRLFGVDTPERGEACFQEATDRLSALAGTEVQLLPDQRLTDSFGRELRYVYTTDGTLIDEQLVTEGLGVAWTEDGQFRERLVAAEEDARAERRGCLWDG